MQLNKSDLIFQLCVYHNYKKEDLQNKDVPTLRVILKEEIKKKN